MSVYRRPDASWREKEHSLLITIGLLLHIWGGYLIWRGLKGQDVFVGHSDIVYVTGVIAITVLSIGLVLLWHDTFSMLVNVCIGEDEMEGTILGSRMWIINLYFFEAMASILVLAAGFIVGVYLWLIRELSKDALRWFARPPTTPAG